jgi:ribosomal protein S18 acetylase RimI-like enzyme
MLDTPAWSALTTRQAHLRQGDGLALRYHPEVGPFAAMADTSPEAFGELARLIPPGGFVLLQTVSPLPPADRLKAEFLGTVLQMLATDEPGEGGGNIVDLGETDIDAMLALTQQTRPGPFGRRTREMGRYIGLRDNGMLAAMAGERMQFDGHVEISAVCVDDAHRGQGLAARLINTLRREILRRGDTPFLHVFDHNRPAVALYERLGFTTRQTFHLYRITHAAS